MLDPDKEVHTVSNWLHYPRFDVDVDVAIYCITGYLFKNDICIS